PSLLAALAPAFDLSAIRPVENQRTYTNVSVYFTLYGILGVILLLQWWKNEFISWDPEQCGSNWISLPKEKFWLPDIVINEFMEENKAPTVPYVYLYDDGTVKNSFPVRVVSSCNLNIYTFPFDIQNCSLTFNSYIYYGERWNQVKTVKVDCSWGGAEIGVLSEEQTNPSARIITEDIYSAVRRRATMYVVNLLLPSCFLITLDLLSFLLPPQSTDRSSFKMTLILGYTVFLLLMNDLLPVTGNTIPLINVFFSLCLALMVGSLLETILITNLLSNSSDLSPVPRWIRVLFLNFLGCLVCMPRKTEKPKGLQATKNDVLAKLESDEGPSGTEGSAEEDEALQELKSLSHVLQAIRSEVEQQQKETQSSEEWIQVGFIIDRLLFGLYIVFISVSFITIIIVWVNSYSQ
uniref:Neurotransmitter-gated ion-channel ligand-binding domain-containing protein n=1 Tax=Fundulus heteroclitus TaxID=8078 RepID=A0A3Q2TZU7_FUNHE